MSWMRRMEGALERCIEGFFNEKLAGTLQPVEVLQQLIKVMLDQATGRGFAPEWYTVYMQPDEQAKFAVDAALIDELKSCLAKEAKEQGVKFNGTLEIRLLPDATLAHGCLRVEAVFATAESTEAEDDLQSTRIFSRPDCPEIALPAVRPARLRVTRGADCGVVLELGAGRVNIGRLQSNDLVLADQSSSRLHAYICWDKQADCHMLFDAESLNGTKCNGQGISRSELKDGDRIAIGNTEMTYEVR